MEYIILIVIGIVAIVAGYAGIKYYIARVSEKYNYDIDGAWTKYIPVVAWFIVILKMFFCEIKGTTNNWQIDVVIIVFSAILYSVILYIKTKSIVHSILISVLQNIIGFVYVLTTLIVIIFGRNKGRQAVSSPQNQEIQYDVNPSNAQSDENQFDKIEGLTDRESQEMTDRRNMYL